MRKSNFQASFKSSGKRLRWRDGPGHKLVTKLKVLKTKIKEWVGVNVGDVQIQKFYILVEIQALDKEEGNQLSIEEGKRRVDLKEELQRKLREKEIK